MYINNKKNYLSKSIKLEVHIRGVDYERGNIRSLREYHCGIPYKDHLI